MLSVLLSTGSLLHQIFVMDLETKCHNTSTSLVPFDQKIYFCAIKYLWHVAEGRLTAPVCSDQLTVNHLYKLRQSTLSFWVSMCCHYIKNTFLSRSILKRGMHKNKTCSISTISAQILFLANVVDLSSITVQKVKLIGKWNEPTVCTL